MKQPARIARSHGFTLLEVMVAIAILGLGLLTLLGLHHQSLQSIIAAQAKTRASMLAQLVMTEAELERFPDIGVLRGNFEHDFPGQYPNFRWQRAVQGSGNFPDLREVTVVISFGPALRESFSITEFMHNPIPPEGLSIGGAQAPAGGNSLNGNQPGTNE